MGLFELNHNNMTGNTLKVGDLIISWDNPEEDEDSEENSLQKDNGITVTASDQQSKNT